MNAVATRLRFHGDWSRLVRRDVLTRALGSAPRFPVVPGQHAATSERSSAASSRRPPTRRTGSSWFARRGWSRGTLLAIDGVAAILPALQLTPLKGNQCSKNASLDEATDAQLCLPLKEEG